MSVKVIVTSLSSFICMIMLTAVNLYCVDQPEYRTLNQSGTHDSISSIQNNGLSELQRKIYEGALQNLDEETAYDLTMGYYVLTYKDGINTGSMVFPGGDLDPGIGVCTDVIVRSLRYAGLVDLQEAVNTDIKNNMFEYPLSRWGKKKTDPNIDHRRVMNLEVWFSKHWNIIGDEVYMPGDIVVWDMNEDGASDHIGIVSAGKSGERHTVIHNHPDPGHIADEDKLFRWKITGHYRIRE